MGSRANASRKVAKRVSGEGSVASRPRPDGLWQARWTVVEDGVTKRRAVYAKTREEAARKLREALGRRDSGIRSATRQSVGDYLTGWLDAIRPQVGDQTFIRYGTRVRLHLIPLLGKRPLARLEPLDVERAYAELLRRGLAPATVAGVHRTLHRALRDAERKRMTPTNIAGLVDPPRIGHREMTTLTEAQARAFLAAAEGDRYEALYTLAITSGLREGELLALRWRDVDLDAGWLRVTGTLTRVPRDASDGGPATVQKIAETKTAKSRRRVELAGIAVDALRRHRAAQLEARVAAANVWTDLDLVFCGPTGGPLHKDKLGDAYHALLTRAGLPRLRFHDLRHTAATLMLGRGVHPKIVSEMLGHSTVAITLDLYSHVTPTMQRAAVAELDGVFV